jgi:hypothetical protein
VTGEVESRFDERALCSIAPRTCVSPDELWTQVGACFDTDDGSLPGVEVSGLSPPGVAAIYAMLRRRSRLEGEPPYSFWSLTEQADLPVDSVPNAAALVAGGQAEPFHLCISGVIAGGVELPTLGVFVWPDTVELDYRMGDEWNSSRVAGLFELLRDCCDLDDGATVTPAKSEGPPYPDRFASGWGSYASSRTP